MKQTSARRRLSTKFIDYIRRYLQMRPRLRRLPSHEFVKFVLFGAINTGLNFLVYLCLLRILNYLAAYTLAYLGGILSAYYLNARFVFREPLELRKAIQFPVVYLVQFFAGIVLLFLLVEGLGVGSAVAPFLVIIFTVPITYLLSRFIIRRDN